MTKIELDLVRAQEAISHLKEKYGELRQAIDKLQEDHSKNREETQEAVYSSDKTRARVDELMHQIETDIDDFKHDLDDLNVLKGSFELRLSTSENKITELIEAKNNIMSKVIEVLVILGAVAYGILTKTGIL